MANSPFSTPKRKRSEMLHDGNLTLNTTARFTFDVNSTLDDGSVSPRSRVAHKFRGLALGSGGGGTGPSADPGAIDNHAEESSRKRVRLPDVEMLDADSMIPAGARSGTVAHRFQPSQPVTKEGSPSGRRLSAKSVGITLDEAVVEQTETVANTSADDSDSNYTTPSLTPPSPPPAPSRSQPRKRTSKKRAGTPPFRSSQSPPTTTTTTTTSPKSSKLEPSTTTTTITDPLRASLTWHDDEITIYDPDDSDDDGTGINGIGFKPTPAIAYARTVRRRQQLAEYRKREEREARAKRSLRRRGAGGGLSPPPGLGDNNATGGAGKTKGMGGRERRRVRFLERERDREKGREGGVGVGVAVADGEMMAV